MENNKTFSIQQDKIFWKDLLEDERVVINDNANVETLKKLFECAAKNQRIFDISDTEELTDNISYPTLKDIMK